MRFRQDILDRIYCHEAIRKVPALFQTIIIKIIEEILLGELEENPDGKLSQLFGHAETSGNEEDC